MQILLQLGQFKDSGKFIDQAFAAGRPSPSLEPSQVMKAHET